MSIDKQTIFEKTPKGVIESKGRWGIFASSAQKILALIDGITTTELVLAASGMKEKKFLIEMEGLLRDRLIRESWAVQNPQFTINASPLAPQGIHVAVEDTQVFMEAMAKQKSANKMDVEEELLSFDDVEEKLRRESSQSAQREEAEQLLQIEEKVKESARRKAKEQEETKARERAERKAREEAERQAREEAERKAKEEAERQAREEEEQLAKAEAERAAREEAERLAREEEARLAREEAERKAKEETERLAREEEERLAKAEAERAAREEAERLAREEEARLAREEAERKAKEETERLARKEEERLAKAEAERAAREEAERLAREEAERAAREEAERKAREEAERLAREEEERLAKEEAERAAREEAERLAREEEARLAREEAERKAKEEAERKAREEEERLAKEEAERAAREEAERLAREEEARLAREEAERKAREEAERAAREEAERKAKEEAERKAREEEERLAKEEAERAAREEAERLAREEEARLAREEAERKAREEAERAAREEAERKAKEEAERKVREEEERLAKKEAERAAREEAERQAREEEARLAREEAARKEREEAERKAKVEAERKAREEAERAEAEHEALMLAPEPLQVKEEREIHVPEEAEPGERAAKALRMLKWGAAGVLALLAVGLTAVHFVALSSTQKRLETLISARLGEPVKMQSLHIALFPSPYLKLRQIEIGSQGGIRIADARIHAGWGTLFGDGRRVERIELEKIDLAAGVLENIASWPAKSVQQQPAYQIGQITFQRANIETSEGTVPSFRGEFGFSNSGRIEKAWVGSEDGALRADFAPASDGLAVTVSARDVIPLTFLPVRIDSLQAAGTVNGRQIRFAELDGSSHGGKVSGSMVLSWDQGWSVAGDVRIVGANIVPSSTASDKLAVSGKLDAALSFAQKAEIPENLFRPALLTGSASLRTGRVAGFDLPAAIHYDVEAIYSAHTDFDSWTFKLEPLGDKQAYKAVRMTGPDLQVEGRAEVSTRGAMSGALKLKVETRKKVVRGNYILGGTLERPTIRRATPSN